jgi:hypothetical protein
MTIIGTGSTFQKLPHNEEISVQGLLTNVFMKEHRLDEKKKQIAKKYLHAIKRDQESL